MNVSIQYSEDLDGWTDGMSLDFEGTGPVGSTVAGFLNTPATTATKQFARLRFSRIND